ncbi:MAG: Uma2 family endonuclease, partial [Chloroflexi bacterium]|nr:Uma2 family endonuclease [Chloroflexota bacterium]
QIIKRQLYEHHGVQEYWLIHPTDRVVTIYILENGQYGRPDIYEFSATVTAKTVPGVAVEFERVAQAISA